MLSQAVRIGAMVGRSDGLCLSRGQFGLSYSSSSSKNKSYVFVKLTEQALKAIEEFVSQVLCPLAAAAAAA